VGLAVGVWALAGCTVKAIGDPKRPITIEAHITLDIKGLQQTASNIEDLVSQGAAQGGTNTR
jgi:hypothetical protein